MNDKKTPFTLSANVDLEALSEQLGYLYNEATNNANEPEADVLEGIIALLEAVQDAAQ